MLSFEQFLANVINQQRLVITRGRLVEKSKAKDKRRKANRTAKAARKRNRQ